MKAPTANKTLNIKIIRSIIVWYLRIKDDMGYLIWCSFTLPLHY